MICKVPSNPGYSVTLNAQGFCRDVNRTKSLQLASIVCDRESRKLLCSPPGEAMTPCFCPQETVCQAVPATEYQCQVGGLGFLPSLRS